MSADIARTALMLFAERGFSAVTVDDIAAAADISPRTFFRYFASKEDVLFGDPSHIEESIVDALKNAPDEEQTLVALHRILVDLTKEMESDQELIQLRLRILEQTPDTMAAAFEQRRSYQHRLTPVVANRMGLDESDLRPALVVNLSMAAVYVASWHWLTTKAQRPLHQLVDEALADASSGLAQLAPPAPSLPRDQPKSGPGRAGRQSKVSTARSRSQLTTTRTR
jgi:AcrR family transcriptional regulator